MSRDLHRAPTQTLSWVYELLYSAFHRSLALWVSSCRVRLCALVNCNVLWWNLWRIIVMSTYVVVTELDKENLSAIWGENWGYLCLCNTFGSSQSQATCGLNETWASISCFWTQVARSTCFVYKGKPVSFDGFSYGRKTLFVASGHFSGQAGYYGYLCTRLPTSRLGQALVNKQTNKQLAWMHCTSIKESMSEHTTTIIMCVPEADI